MEFLSSRTERVPARADEMSRSIAKIFRCHVIFLGRNRRGMFVAMRGEC